MTRLAHFTIWEGSDAMTEAEWLASADPMRMLEYLAAGHVKDAGPREPGLPRYWTSRHPIATDRKLRLFACACIRAEGILSDKLVSEAEKSGPPAAATAIGWATSWTQMGTRSTEPTAAVRAAFLRDIFGNPWRSMGILQLPHESIGHPWLRWNDGTVPKIAQHIYDNRRRGDMPILADALEDAGCDNEDILRHCRAGVMEYNDGGQSYWYTDTSGPQLTPIRAAAAHVHVRGCWVIDLLLGKE